MEILSVIIIIGILVAIVLPNFAPVREKVLDKEASANLKLIQDAERFYKLETDRYYPNSGSVTDMATINQNLKLSLPTATDRKWNYSCKTNGCADATRYSGPDSRKWYLLIDGSEPVSGSTCP
jgi:type II secretory pathway pseudopilin PulG